MKPFLVRPASGIRGEIVFPGDKSIAHRYLILSAISTGRTKIENLPANKDCLATLNSLRRLGIRISRTKNILKGAGSVEIFGRGLNGLRRPKAPIFINESGTTFRLLLGVLAGQNFTVRLCAGKSLSRRPMLRVTAPLRMMGARIKAAGPGREEYPPITITGASLTPITYKMPVASAQVKSAILLAGLFAKGATQIIEPIRTRDHTERALKLFKADIKIKANTVVITGSGRLVPPKKVFVPGDLSSASFFLVMGLLLPASRLIIRRVSLNSSRMGALNVLKRMGARIQLKRLKVSNCGLEPCATVLVESSVLKGVTVKREETPLLIDELPVLMVAACFAKDRTVFEGVGELRVKETDRLRSMVNNLRCMGAKVEVCRSAGMENVIITGTQHLAAAKLKSFGDHRTAMSLVVAGLKADGNTLIDDISCIDKSFPGFIRTLNSVIVR
jgi:3-phosphoshikimate 1-carboxyvinyltransferase